MIIRTALLSFLALLLSTPVTSFASNTTNNSADNSTHTCLSNENVIAIGNSQAQIQDACGEPNDSTSTTKPITEDQEVTHWYYLTQFSTDNGSGDSTYSIIRIVVQFNKKGIVTSLHVYTPTNTDTSEEEIDLLGYVILIGDKKQQVEDILGKPFETKKLIKPEVVGKVQTTTWTYIKSDTENSSNTQKLVLIDKKLAEIQS